MARLRSKIWVQAYIKRLELQTTAAYVTAHGDDHSGAILIKIAKMDGFCLLYTSPSPRDQRGSRMPSSA